MTVIYAIILFCVLIFIHELGHFIAAKSCGVKVNQFAIGMGPAFFKRQKGETEYSLRVFPIGGFCAMEGEDEESGDPRAFNNKKAWQKAIVVAAGPLMNLILAVILMCVVAFMIGTPVATVDSFVEGSHAEEAGLKVGDEIKEINGVTISEWNDVSDALGESDAGDAVSIEAARDGEEITVKTTLMDEDGRAIIGITPKMERSAGASIVNGTKTTWTMTTSMYTVIKQLFTGEVSTKDLSGPVGIVYMVNQSVNEGFMYFLYLMALLSLNLAIVNLLPLPALDGGRLLMLLIRKLTGKVITDKIEARINAIGIVLLMMLMVYVTWNDIVKFIVPIFK